MQSLGLVMLMAFSLLACTVREASEPPKAKVTQAVGANIYDLQDNRKFISADFGVCAKNNSLNCLTVITKQMNESDSAESYDLTNINASDDHDVNYHAVIREHKDMVPSTPAQ